jgi:hypothetical protein
LSSFYLRRSFVEKLGVVKVEDMLVVPVEKKYHVATGSTHDALRYNISHNHESEKNAVYFLIF